MDTVLKAGDDAGGVKTTTTNATVKSQSAKIRLQTGDSYTTRLEVGQAGTIGINRSAGTEQLEVNGKIKCDDVKYQITDTAGGVSDQSLVSLHDSVSTLSTNITSCVTTTALDTALEDYATTSDLPPEYGVMGADDTYAAGLVATGSVTHNDEFLRKDGGLGKPLPTRTPTPSTM